MTCSRPAGRRRRWSEPVACCLPPDCPSLFLLVPETLVVLIGFACVGAGLSFVFPLVLSAGVRLRIAAIATAGYEDFLIGRPVIGLGAEVTSLCVTLGFVALLCGLVAALAGPLQRSSATGR